MNKLPLDGILKGVLDDSYGEGADRVVRFMAQIFVPGMGDFNVPISQEQAVKLSQHPPMLAKIRIPFTLESRAEVRTSEKSGRKYARENVIVKWDAGMLEVTGSILDDYQKKAG